MSWTCPICNSEVLTGIPLSDGRLLHDSCIQTQEKLLSDLLGKNSNENINLSGLQRRLTSERSVIVKLTSFFTGRHVQVAELELAIQQCQQRMDQYQLDITKLQNNLTSFYDYYLTYPPDWEARKTVVFKRDKVCQHCRYRRNLQVHHNIMLANGGTNRVENLILLCKHCHTKRHGVADFHNSSEEHQTAFSERIVLINEAIRSQKEVEFLYKKPTDFSYKKRIVQPYELKEFEYRDGSNFTLCLRGYCRLREDERAFALKRMRGLKIRETENRINV